MASSKKQPSPARPAPKPSAKIASPPAAAGLAVLVDGVPLPDAEADTVWRAFSAYMDEHQGDLAGFAAARGFREVKPEYRRGQAVLVVKR